jgi:hypothetical protein
MQSLLQAQKGPIPAPRFILVVAGALLESREISC